MNPSKQKPSATDKPVTIMEMILYNMAGFSFNVYDTILYAWLPYFYLPPEGSERTAFIPLAALGIIMAGGRVLDAVTDPLEPDGRRVREDPSAIVVNVVVKGYVATRLQGFSIPS